MGALGVERPDEELLLYPTHRMLVQGDEAMALFNTPEILVAAKDLINGKTMRMDVIFQEVTYIHLLLSDHQIFWANGVETESFHQANAALTTLEVSDRKRFAEQFPDLEFDPHTYGRFARRNLSATEATIMYHLAQTPRGTIHSDLTSSAIIAFALSDDQSASPRSLAISSPCGSMITVIGNPKIPIWLASACLGS